MYEYQYISILTDWHFIGNRTLDQHRTIIDEQAEQGWRLVCYIPIQINSEGQTVEADLVFERALK